MMLFIFVTSPTLLMGQTVLLVAKAGNSSNGTVGWGSGGDASWDSGPLFSLGARVRHTDRIAFEGAFEYSSHDRIRHEWDAPLVNAPKLSRLDLTGSVRWSWGLFRQTYFIFMLGPVLTYQKTDDIVVMYESSQYTTPGKRELRLGFHFGLGFESRIADRWELSVEGGLRMRFGLAATVQLSVAYAL
jgi:hypothetical protein